MKLLQNGVFGHQKRYFFKAQLHGGGFWKRPMVVLLWTTKTARRFENAAKHFRNGSSVSA